MAIATTTALILGGAMVASAGIAASQAHQQNKAMKSAAEAADAQQQRMLKAAQEHSDKEESTALSAVSRARQKALAAATAASGRASTIKTGSGGIIGSAPGSQKQLIGE